MAKRGRPAKEKNPFENVPEEFKAQVLAMKDHGEIRVKISEVTLNQVTLMQAKAEDQDLKEKKEAAKEANAIYKEGSKANSERILFCRQVLRDRGQAVYSMDELPDNASVQKQN